MGEERYQCDVEIPGGEGCVPSTVMTERASELDTSVKSQNPFHNVWARSVTGSTACQPAALYLADSCAKEEHRNSYRKRRCCAGGPLPKEQLKKEQQPRVYSSRRNQKTCNTSHLILPLKPANDWRIIDVRGGKKEAGASWRLKRRWWKSASSLVKKGFFGSGWCETSGQIFEEGTEKDTINSQPRCTRPLSFTEEIKSSSFLSRPAEIRIL